MPKQKQTEAPKPIPEAVLCDLSVLAEDAIEATGWWASSIIDGRDNTITVRVEFPRQKP
jgi:hypothetical protein